LFTELIKYLISVFDIPLFSGDLTSISVVPINENFLY